MRKGILVTVAALITVVVFSTGSSARQAAGKAEHNRFYVAPDGTESLTDPQAGTRDKPWNLATALSHPPRVQPGATIFLRGGVYNGNFVSELVGKEKAPIKVTAAPGARVIIEASDPMNDSFVLKGAWTIYHGLTIRGTDPRRLITETDGANYQNNFNGVILENSGKDVEPLNVKGQIKTILIHGGIYRTILGDVSSATEKSWGGQLSSASGPRSRPSLSAKGESPTCPGSTGPSLFMKVVQQIGDFLLGTKVAYADGAITPNMPEEVVAYPLARPV